MSDKTFENYLGVKMDAETVKTIPTTRAEISADKPLPDGRIVRAGTLGTVTSVRMLGGCYLSLTIDLDPQEFKDMYLIAGGREVRLFYTAEGGAK